ncbi:MAG: hypothetical protein JW801_06030 [Bacteroidales bacterium]|nr:hypothetical protein [Bacteroidales bacterium]
MKTKLILAALLLAGLFGCEKQKLENLEIKVVTINPFCFPSDSLVMNNENIFYNMFTYCMSSEYNLEEAVNAEDWNEILQLFDWKTFKKVESNTNNIASDGSDTYIEVRYGAATHRVRFGSPEDSAMAPIQLFAEKLVEIKSGYYVHGILGDWNK